MHGCGVAVLFLLTSFGCDPGGPIAQVDAGDAAAPVDAGSRNDAGPYSCAPLPAEVAEGRLGTAQDSTASPQRRLVLMGGSAEVDAASRSFVEAAAGGDVLVLRVSGSVDSYTPYFFEELQADPTPASVTTLRTDLPAAAGDPSVLCRVGAAEALWLAGGDQWDYLDGWPVALHTALADIAARGAGMGGTSAGAMVLGQAAFNAAQGGLTSATALQDPLASYVTLTLPAFAQPELDGHLIDTHFTQREREGRLLVFLARMRQLTGSGGVRGLGLDERAAIIIENASFHVLAEPGRSAWLYEVSGTARLEPGTPLDLEGVVRVRLDHDARGDWPLDLGAWSGEAISVRAGVIGPA